MIPSGYGQLIPSIAEQYAPVATMAGSNSIDRFNPVDVAFAGVGNRLFTVFLNLLEEGAV
jgi:hypothetical protein